MAVVVLVVGGVVLLLAGVAFVILGLFVPQLLLDKLPPGALLDAASIGGAGVALGMLLFVLAAIHLGIAMVAARDPARSATSVVVLGSLMSVTMLGVAIALASTAMTDVTVAPLLAIGAALLFGLTGAYAAAAGSALRARGGGPSTGPD